MKLSEIIGNAEAVKALQGMAESGRVPHAMMIYENDGCGAMLFVTAFLGELMDSDRKVSRLIHPDVHYVYPVANGTKVNEKVENLRSVLFLRYWADLMKDNPYSLENEVSSAFGIEGKQAAVNNAQAKEILETVYLTSIEGGYKAVVVYLPEKMNPAAANRLLKAVEEPPEKTVFIMITHAPEKVMQTISSRCQALRLLPYTKAEIEEILVSRFGKDPADAAQAALLAGGSPGAALAYLSDKEDYSESMDIFSGLMDALAAKDLTAALSAAERMAGLSSREKQKAFCRFAGECLRKIFLLQQNLPQISGISPDEQAFYAGLAAKCKKSFPRKAAGLFDKAMMLIDRNVNQKVLFSDLVCQIYINY